MTFEVGYPMQTVCFVLSKRVMRSVSLAVLHLPQALSPSGSLYVKSTSSPLSCEYQVTTFLHLSCSGYFPSWQRTRTNRPTGLRSQLHSSSTMTLGFGTLISSHTRKHSELTVPFFLHLRLCSKGSASKTRALPSRRSWRGVYCGSVWASRPG